MLPPTTNPAPGWYADPERYGGERYWDGEAWSDQRRASPAPLQVAAVVVPGPVVVQPPGNGMAVTALVCGIVGAVFGLIPWTFWLAWILGIIAIVFGALGRRREEREPAAGKRSMATAGLVLGIVAIALGIIGVIVLATFIHHAASTLNDLNDCLGDPDQLNCH
jgi:lysylphosphatidylglycerol synthetase-like protein (DUF2156 family)